MKRGIESYVTLPFLIVLIILTVLTIVVGTCTMVG
jgi:hypothetical protein